MAVVSDRKLMYERELRILQEVFCACSITHSYLKYLNAGLLNVILFFMKKGWNGSRRVKL